MLPVRLRMTCQEHAEGLTITKLILIPGRGISEQLRTIGSPSRERRSCITVTSSSRDFYARKLRHFDGCGRRPFPPIVGVPEQPDSSRCTRRRHGYHQFAAGPVADRHPPRDRITASTRARRQGIRERSLTGQPRRRRPLAHSLRIPCNGLRQKYVPEYVICRMESGASLPYC